MRDDKDVCRKQQTAAARADQILQGWLLQTRDNDKNGWGRWQKMAEMVENYIETFFTLPRPSTGAMRQERCGRKK
jgi:hypothetical protein